MFKHKVNKGLGQFKLLPAYNNAEALDRWATHFRSIAYKGVIKTIITDSATDSSNQVDSVDEMVADHYGVLRTQMLCMIKKTTCETKRHNLRLAFLGLRSFRDSNREFISSIRNQHQTS